MDGGNPLYSGDPLIEQLVRVREVRIASSAKAVNRLRGDTMMAYCESYLQVRDPDLLRQCKSSRR